MLRVEIMKNEEKNTSYLVRQLKNEEDFDATQGRCCFTLGNRRGVRLVQLFDIVFLPYIPRVVLAILSYKNDKMFPTYAKLRRFTFYFNVVLMIGGVFSFVVIDILKFGGVHYLYILAMLIACLCYLGTDYHWTNCVLFYWKHPPNRKEDINWLFSDSEPQYAF